MEINAGTALRIQNNAMNILKKYPLPEIAIISLAGTAIYQINSVSLTTGGAFTLAQKVSSVAIVAVESYFLNKIRTIRSANELPNPNAAADQEVTEARRHGNQLHVLDSVFLNLSNGADLIIEQPCGKIDYAKISCCQGENLFLVPTNVDNLTASSSTDPNPTSLTTIQQRNRRI